MNISRKWLIKDELYGLCNRKRYFTGGTNEQYKKMFEMVEDETFTARDIATAIYIASTNKDFTEILKDVKNIYRQADKIIN